MSRSDRSFMRAFSTDFCGEGKEEATEPTQELPVVSEPDAQDVVAEIEISSESEVGYREFEAPHFALDVGLEWERKVSVPTTVTEESARVVTDYRIDMHAKKKWEPKLEVDQFAFSQPCQLFMEQADAIVSVLDSHESGSQIINIRSWARGEGRTTVSIALAKNLADQGYGVVLLDGDFDNPALGDELGISFREGWETCLDGKQDLAEVCIRSVEDRFCIIPRANSRFSRFESALPEKLTDVLEKLSKNFDYVLIDAGPGSQIWDQLGAEIGNLIVVDNRKTLSRDLPEFFENASDRVQTVVGTIHNFSKAA